LSVDISMQDKQTHKIVRVSKGRGQQTQRQVVEEYPLRLRVNGRELGTLICSPHKLKLLLAGFLHLQGFIESLDDIQSLGICEDFGLADVRIKNQLPEQLQPTLTSGCGTGISYNLPTRILNKSHTRPQHYSTQSLLQLMQELNERADQYRSHGGIHSAALGDQHGRLLLHAEDIGRHNTVDRIAGAALFRKIDLQGKMLITSGRVSSEMVAKAARLGIGLLASRTSPTDQAIALCEQAGITLAGYVRGSSLEIYSHVEQLHIPADHQAAERINDTTGVILAGGESQRMGSDKSLLAIQGARFIDHVYRRMASLFDEVIIVTNSPELYAELPCRKVVDIYRGQGALAGIHAGLKQARNERIFVVGCDMPFISTAVVKEICSHSHAGDLVIPHTRSGHEPLHALYNKSCLPAMERVLDTGQKRIMLFFNQVEVITLPASLIHQLDPEEQSFQNINTPEDYFRLRGTLIAAEQPLSTGSK
jgi:FdhD protein